MPSKVAAHSHRAADQRLHLYIQANAGFACLVLFAAICMVAVIPMDRSLTMWLHQWNWPLLSSVMGRSVFEGEGLGGSDFSVIWLIIVFAGYVYCVLAGHRSPLARFRPHMGFILVSSFWGCLCNVHALKWIIGRARPYLVLRDGLPFSGWYELGPCSVAHGANNGSFPSGHTALAFIFMTLAYVLAGDERHSPGVRTAGGYIGVFALLNALVMAFARTMSLSHWVSDCLASIWFSWIIIHFLYHCIFHLPDVADRPGSVNAPQFWEIRLCMYQLIMAAGFAMAMIGCRAVVGMEGYAVMILIPVGGFICRKFFIHAMDLWRLAGPARAF